MEEAMEKGIIHSSSRKPDMVLKEGNSNRPDMDDDRMSMRNDSNEGAPDDNDPDDNDDNDNTAVDDTPSGDGHSWSGSSNTQRSNTDLRPRSKLPTLHHK